MQPEEKTKIKISKWARVPITIPSVFIYTLNRLIRESGIPRAEFCRNAFFLGVNLYTKQLGLDMFREMESLQGKNNDLS